MGAHGAADRAREIAGLTVLRDELLDLDGVAN
jgi:hypothetical protein